MTSRRRFRPPPLLPILAVTAGVTTMLGLALWLADPALDQHLLETLRLDGRGAWMGHIRSLTSLGGLAVMGPVALLAAIWLAWRGRRGDALWFAGTVIAGRLVVEGIKLVVRRARPIAIDGLPVPHSFSFPSSHSAGTMLTLTALALLAPRRARVPALVAAAAAACFIGWSRIAIGVHWPSDVMTGLGVGLLCATVGAHWRPGRDA